MHIHPGENKKALQTSCQGALQHRNLILDPANPGVSKGELNGPTKKSEEILSGPG